MIKNHKDLSEFEHAFKEGPLKNLASIYDKEPISISDRDIDIDES